MVKKLRINEDINNGDSFIVTHINYISQFQEDTPEYKSMTFGDFDPNKYYLDIKELDVNIPCNNSKDLFNQLPKFVPYISNVPKDAKITFESDYYDSGKLYITWERYDLTDKEIRIAERKGVNTSIASIYVILGITAVIPEHFMNRADAMRFFTLSTK